jgi:cyclase
VTAGHVHRGDSVPPPRLEEVSDGVFAYIQLDGTWFLNNCGFIAGADGVVVIDSTSTERRARAFRDALRSRTDRPVRALVNTHHHGDHTFGNFVFGGEAPVIAHERCRDEIIATGPPEAMMARLFPGPDWGDCPLTPPNVTFTDRVTLYAGDLEVQLIHVGTPAHTTNDVIAWLPQRRLLFTGDLVFNGGTPFAAAGSIAGWLEALDLLRGLGAERLVPGHGLVCEPRAFDDIEAYLRFVDDAARDMERKGLEPLEYARGLDLGRFAALGDAERIVPNLHRARIELRGGERGAPVDFDVMIREMIDYNGGQPLRCLA